MYPNLRMAYSVIMIQIFTQKPVDANEGKKVDNMKRERSITRGPLTFVRTLTSSSSGDPDHCSLSSKMKKSLCLIPITCSSNNQLEIIILH
jgi:hypothetical protein